MGKLQSISFRGNREKWSRFVFLSKVKGEKRIWNTLERMIDRFFESGKI